MRVECSRKKMIREITPSGGVRRARMRGNRKFVDIPRHAEQGATLSDAREKERTRERERERELLEFK